MKIGGLPIAASHTQGGQPHHGLRIEIGYHRYDTMATQRHDGDDLVVVARPDRKLRTAGLADAGDFDHISAGFLHAAEIWMLSQGLVNRYRDVDTGAGRDVINNARNLNLVPDGSVMGNKSGFRGFVIIGADQK